MENNPHQFPSGRKLESYRNSAIKVQLAAVAVLGSIPLAIAIKEGLLSEAGQEISAALVTFARFLAETPVK